MRRKLLRCFLLTFLVLFAKLLIAQTTEVTGKIMSNESKVPLQGVSVKAVGTNVGTMTNADGEFKLMVPARAKTLEISFVGHQTSRVDIGKTPITVFLEPSDNKLTEVVVTGAYGIKTSLRSTSYNAQVVTNDQLNTIRQTDVNNALAGKVAGLQVRSQSAAALGRNSSIRLNGGSGFSATETGVIYVVDGTILPDLSGINMDDVDNVTVLQGPAAAAQFGSAGGSGAIVITLKKASKNAKGSGVDVNIGNYYDHVYVLPNYQDSYAGGGSADLMKYTWQPGQPEAWKALDGKYYPDYTDDASWGPRMVGQEYIPWYAWYDGTKYSYKTAKLTPQPNNARDFYNVGQTFNNSVSFSKANENSQIRMTYNNLSVKGLIPTSSLQKSIFNLSGSIDISKRLTASANVNYVSSSIYGQIDDDNYSNQTTGSFNQWFHRDLDMGIVKDLRNLRTPDGIYASWNHNNPTSYDPNNPSSFYAGNYWYNFYTAMDLIDQTTHYDRLYGFVALNYKITNDLSLKGTYRKQQNTVWSEQKFSSDFATSGTQTTGNEPRYKGYYFTGTSYSNSENYQLLANYNKKIQDFQVNANAGLDAVSLIGKSNNAQTVNGLNIPNLFTTSNSKDQASIGNGRVKEKSNAVYVLGDLGYKNLIFGNFTLRNDWYSSLNPKNNSVLSKSFGLSFVFSDLTKNTIPWLSFGKLRGSWGEIPQALGTSATSIGAYRYPGALYGVGQYQWNGNYLQSTPDQVVDSSIHGSVKTQKEIGLELRFLNNRLGISATYWDGTEKDLPYSVSVNGASGFSSRLINTGLIKKKGINLQFNAQPIVLRNFSWSINATYAYLIDNTVDSIAPGVQTTPALAGVWGTTMPVLVMSSGKWWGQIYGNGIKRIDGQPVINSAGTGYVNDPQVFFGSVLPKVTGGVQNTFNIYDFSVSASVDYQVGGKFVSLSDQWGSYSGLTSRTATVNDKGNPVRDAVIEGGGVHMVGVDGDGKPMDAYVDAQTYFQNLYNNKTFDPYIYDLTFVKLRELAIGYNLPIKKLGWDKIVNRAQLSLVARNPILIYAKTRDFDPSEISSVSGEAAQYPGSRGFGFNLKVSF